MLRWFAVAVALLGAVTYAGARTPARAQPTFPTNFVTDMTCEVPLSGVSVTFVLPGRDEIVRRFGAAPDQIWIDLSLSYNDFVPGTFIGAGPFTATDGPAGGTFRWDGVAGGNLHFYRLNAHFGDRWIELGRGSFDTPDCHLVFQFHCDRMPDARQTVHFAIPEARRFQGTNPAQRWLDLTLYPDPHNGLIGGFRSGTFIGAGPFPDEVVQFDWHGIVSGEKHYFRVNSDYLGPNVTDALPEGQWITQFTGAFWSLDCRGLPSRIIELPLI